MYSSKDLATWKNEGIILPRQASGELGPTRKGERPHIIRCPSTGEFVLYAHAASEDYQTDKEIVYATSSTVNGQYAYKGPLKNASGAIIAHSDMSAYADDTGAYVLTESGSRLHAGERLPQLAVRQVRTRRSTATPAARSHPRCSRPAAPTTGSARTRPAGAPTTTSIRPRPSMSGPWTYQGFLAPVTDPPTTSRPSERGCRRARGFSPSPAATARSTSTGAITGTAPRAPPPRASTTTSRPTCSSRWCSPAQDLAAHVQDDVEARRRRGHLVAVTPRQVRSRGDAHVAAQRGCDGRVKRAL